MSPLPVVLLEKNDNYIELLSFIFKDFLKTNFTPTFTLADAVKNIPKSGPTLFLIDERLYSENSLPAGVTNKEVIIFKYGNSAGCKSPRSFILSTLLSTLQKEVPALPTMKDEHCTVPLGLLKKIHQIHVPLYTKINNKMVALTKSESIFGQTEYDKYSSKGVAALYVQCATIQTLLGTYLKNILALQLWSELDPVTISKELAINTNRIKGLATILGWNTQIAELTKQNLEKALYIVKSYPKFSNILNYYKKSEFTNADQDSLILMVAFNILDRSNRMTEINKIVITLATLLHDISLTPEEIGNEVTIRKQLIEKGPDAFAEVTKYFKHPETSAQLCKEWGFAPPLVAEIILQQHERPDGTGFPNNITADKIDKTTATYIISQDFAEYFAMYQGKPNYANYITSRAKLFEAETFRVAFFALQEMFKSSIDNQSSTKKI